MEGKCLAFSLPPFGEVAYLAIVPEKHFWICATVGLRVRQEADLYSVSNVVNLSKLVRFNRRLIIAFGDMIEDALDRGSPEPYESTYQSIRDQFSAQVVKPMTVAESSYDYCWSRLCDLSWSHPLWSRPPELMLRISYRPG